MTENNEKNDLSELKFDDGTSVKEKSEKENLVFVLVRHSGCTFCRETLANLSLSIEKISEKNLKPVVVHMGPPESGDKMKTDFGLEKASFVSDPEMKFYRFFGARKGSFKELLGPRIWYRGFIDGVIKGRGLGSVEGDAFQLGGVFLLNQGQVKCLHNPRDAADIEDWDKVLGQI